VTADPDAGGDGVDDEPHAADDMTTTPRTAMTWRLDTSAECAPVVPSRVAWCNDCATLCGDQGAEDTPRSRASNLAQAKLSCSALADQMAPSQWLCTAEGASSYGYSTDTGATADVRGTQGIYMLGTGKDAQRRWIQGDQRLQLDHDVPAHQPADDAPRRRLPGRVERGGHL
jgi:hypothetical protein